MLTPSLPVEADTTLRSQLNPNEQLLWARQPLPHRSTEGSLILVVIGVPWTAFSLFMFGIVVWGMSRPSSSPIPFWFPLFPLSFVFFGVWMLAAPYRMRRNAQKTVYALTNQRALIVSPDWRGKSVIRSMPPADLTARTCQHNADGSGSIFFSRLTTTRHSPGGSGGTYEVHVGFENIVDVRDVDTLIERT